MSMHALIISKQIKWISYRFNSLNLWLEKMPATLIDVRRTIPGRRINVCKSRKPYFNQMSMYILKISSGFCTFEYSFKLMKLLRRIVPSVLTLAIWKSSTWACIYYDAFFAAAPGWSKQMNKINTKKFPSTKSFNNSSIEYNKFKIPD
jgi:hypothetical protein